jgi:hypothetical protein
VLEMLKSTTGVEALGASERAHTNLVAFSELHVSSKFLQSLISVLITRVNDPTIGLHEDCRPKIVLRVPPVRGASGLAACTEHALIESINKFTVLN